MIALPLHEAGSVPNGPPPRLFYLLRKEDPSGVSGLGWVAEGCAFSDGSACMRWLGETASTVIHDGGVEAIIAIHGHEGKTVLIWA